MGGGGGGGLSGHKVKPWLNNICTVRLFVCLCVCLFVCNNFSLQIVLILYNISEIISYISPVLFTNSVSHLHFR